MTGGVAIGGTRAAVRTGAAADAAGLIGAGGVEDAEGSADPHAALRQVTSKQLTPTTGFAITLRGCRGLILDERPAGPPLLP